MDTADAELLTTEEVMDRLLGDAQLKRMASTCILPAVRWGESWRFRKRDLDEWVRSQRLLDARTR